jgi:hypothetical protein
MGYVDNQEIIILYVSLLLLYTIQRRDSNFSLCDTTISNLYKFISKIYRVGRLKFNDNNIHQISCWDVYEKDLKSKKMKSTIK